MYSRTSFGISMLLSAFALVCVSGCPDVIQLPGLNQNPVADAGPDKTAEIGRRTQLDGSGSADADGDSLTYSWTQSYGEAVQISSSNAMVATFVPPVEGTFEFTLTVSDGRGGSDSDVVRVNVGGAAPSNTAPVAVASASPNPASAGQTVTLDGSESYDPDGDPLGYNWVQESGPPVYLSSRLAQKPTFVAPDLEETTVLGFSLTVDDGELFASAQVEVTVTVGGGPSGTFRITAQAVLFYRGTVLETAVTELGALANSRVKAVRVRLPSGEYVDLPQASDPVPSEPLGFYIHLQGMPEIGAGYTFQGLDEDGNPIDGYVCEATYSGTRVDPPRGVDANIDEGVLVVTWGPVTPTQGFDPGAGLGGYQMELHGSDGLYLSGRYVDTRGTLSLERLPAGLYRLITYAVAVAPESSCRPADLMDDCTSSDVSQQVLIEIGEDGSASIVSP